MRIAQRIEHKADELRNAERVGFDLRKARGPWAVRNQQANSKRQARLRRELRELYDQQFRGAK